MGNCCYKRICLLDPYWKCCYKYLRPIPLEIIYIIGKLISFIFLIWGISKIPWSFIQYDKENKKLKTVIKALYIVGFITSIIKLVFFIIILLLRIFKAINGSLNKLVLIFCYIIFWVDHFGEILVIASLASILGEFVRIKENYQLNLIRTYPVVYVVFIGFYITGYLHTVPFQVDIQLIRFKTDLSYDEYKQSDKEIKEKKNDTTYSLQVNNKNENEQNLETINEIQINNKNVLPLQQNNNIQPQNPQNP